MRPHAQQPIVEKDCYFCQHGFTQIDYKDIQLLRRFTSSYAKIVPRKRTGVCLTHQHKLSEAIKRARTMALFALRTEVAMAMLGMNDLKLGTAVTWKGEPYVVISAQHVQMGRGGAIVRTKLKNLINGNVLEETFKSGDRLEEAGLGRGKASYLYAEGDTHHFMDSESFDQFSLTAEELGMYARFLKEGQELDLMTYKERPVSVKLPIKMTFQVTQTMDAGRGNTAQGNVLKDATIETGFTLKVPLFIKQGDTIVVNTDTGEYVERA